MSPRASAPVRRTHLLGVVLGLALGVGVAAVPGATAAVSPAPAAATSSSTDAAAAVSAVRPCWRVGARADTRAVERAGRTALRTPARQRSCAAAVGGGERVVVSLRYRSRTPVRPALLAGDGARWKAAGRGPQQPRSRAWRTLTWTAPATTPSTRSVSVGLLSRSRVEVSGARVTRVAKVRTPTPTPSPTPSPSGTPTSAMPSRVAAVYWTNWGRGTALDQLPAAYNVIFAAFAYGDGSGTGAVVFRPDDGSGIGPDAFAAQVRNAQAAGDRVVLSVGGANPVGLRLTTSTHVDQLVASLAPIVDRYGFDGVDWDLEQADIVTADTLLEASRRLKARYGARFIVTATPAPSSVTYKTFASRAGDLLDYIAPQYYDYADADRLAGIRYRTRELVTTYGVPARKIGVGTKVGGDPLTAPAAYWRDAVVALRSTWPDLAGASVWEATRERTSGDTWASTVAPSALRR